MSELLRVGTTVKAESAPMHGTVGKFLGGGGQGEVYEVKVSDGQTYALKWYFPTYLAQDSKLEERLKAAINRGAPTDSFLWPIDLVRSEARSDSFGYLMQLREPRFKGIVALMRREIEPGFRALARAGTELVQSYYQLHARGLCYRDINFGNVFFDPDSGEVRICDNDNVDIEGVPGPIAGTPRFMAPELVTNTALPSQQTDLFSLAVLLFYMYTVSHPLEGKKEYDIRSFDMPAMRKIYGAEPVFVYDPQDQSNRPVPGYHQNVIDFWKVYPAFLTERFTKAFTVGLRDAEARVRETVWRDDLLLLHDSVVYCQHCGSENFYDPEVLRTKGKSNPCWNCEKDYRLPPRLRIGKRVVMLNHNTKLYLHHIQDRRDDPFKQVMAEVIQNPTNPSLWGLRNLSTSTWYITSTDGNIKQVEPGRAVSLIDGIKVNFGLNEGEIKVG